MLSALVTGLLLLVQPYQAVAIPRHAEIERVTVVGSKPKKVFGGSHVGASSGGLLRRRVGALGRSWSA